MSNIRSEVDSDGIPTENIERPVTSYDIPISITVSDATSPPLIGGVQIYRTVGSHRPVSDTANILIKVLDRVDSSVEKRVKFHLTGYRLDNKNLMEFAGLLTGIDPDRSGTFQGSEGYIPVKVNPNVNDGTYFVRVEIKIDADDTGKNYTRNDEILVRFDK